MIEALLDRSKEGVEAKEKENTQINEYLSSFKVATYKYSDTHVEVSDPRRTLPPLSMLGYRRAQDEFNTDACSRSLNVRS